MPITPTYPGVYIEELPSLNHSVTAAPTSVTVFVGFTHPFKTKAPGKAVQLFSFADYQANFGGFFSFGPWPGPSTPSPMQWPLDYVGNAVFQFFQNGGSTAWVVGLTATDFQQADGQTVPLAAATAEIDLGSVTATFTALEPTTADTPMSVQLANVTSVPAPSSGGSASQTISVADIIITYGSQVEIYRAVPAVDPAAADTNGIAARLGQSRLVSVLIAPKSAGTEQPEGQADTAPTLETALQTAAFPKSPQGNPRNSYPLNSATPPPQNATLIDTSQYGNVFQTGASLDVDVHIFNLMVLPGISPVNDAYSSVLSQALAYCEQKRAFLIMDAPPNATTSTVSPAPEAQLPPGITGSVAMDAYWNGEPPPVPLSPNGAIYFPYLNTVDQVTQQSIVVPPSGFVAGIYANEDASWNVAKAPAGLETVLTGANGVVPSGRMTDMQQGVLNGDGVNCLRDFSGIGTVVYGARTLVSDNPAFEQWKYVPVRRTALFIEQSLYGSLGWAVFQPNAEPLWNALTQEVNAFMLTLFRANYFQGTTPSAAFLVQCDSTTTTQDDIDQGVVNILVGFAPLKPAEFVVIQISQLAGQSQT